MCNCCNRMMGLTLNCRSGAHDLNVFTQKKNRTVYIQYIVYMWCVQRYYTKCVHMQTIINFPFTSKAWHLHFLHFCNRLHSMESGFLSWDFNSSHQLWLTQKMIWSRKQHIRTNLTSLQFSEISLKGHIFRKCTVWYKSPQTNFVL